MSTKVADWLRGLGLEQYAAAFDDNAIDAEVLRELTAGDLTDLGVSLVGHRRKLLAAIAALRDEPASTEGQSGSTPLLPRASTDPAPKLDITPGGASPAHGDVLRLGGLDRARGSARPRRHA